MNIENKIKEYLVYSLTNISNTKNIRGKDRTVKLHSLCFDIYKHLYREKNVEVFYEYRNAVDGYNRTFDIDVLVKDLDNNNLTSILCKSVQSDYNKNGNNYTNTIVGEIVRSLSPVSQLKLDNVIFMNFIPYFCPSFKGNTVKWQKVKHVTTNNTIKHLNNTFACNKVQIINIRYNFENRENLKTKHDFSLLTINDICLDDDIFNHIIK